MANTPPVPNGMARMTNGQLFGNSSLPLPMQDVGVLPLAGAFEDAIALVTLDQLADVLTDRGLVNEILGSLPYQQNMGAGTTNWVRQFYNPTSQHIDRGVVRDRIRLYHINFPADVRHDLNMASDNTTLLRLREDYMAQAFLRTVLNELVRSNHGLAQYLVDRLIATRPMDAVLNSLGLSGPQPGVLGGAIPIPPPPELQSPQSSMQQSQQQQQQNVAQTSMMGPSLSSQPQTPNPFSHPATATPQQRLASDTSAVASPGATSTSKPNKRYYCPLCGHKLPRWNDLNSHWFRSHCRSGRSAAWLRDQMNEGSLGPWTDEEAKQKGKDKTGVGESAADKKNRKAMEKDEARWLEGMRTDPETWEKQAQEDEGYPTWDPSFTNRRRQKISETKESKKKQKGGLKRKGSDNGDDEVEEKKKNQKSKRGKKDEE